MSKVSDSQTKASRAWEERNRKKASRDAGKRAGRSFLRNHAIEEELQEYEQLIKERREALANEE